MPNLNKVMLMGNLTRDPELRYLPSNMAVVNIGLAINRRWKNQQGESQEDTTFVDCEAFGRTAEVINQYLKKGRPIYIEGRLKLDQWQDRDGNNRSRMKVVVESFEFIDSRGGDGGSGGGGENRSGGGSYGGGRSNDRGGDTRRPAGNAGGNPGGRSGGDDYDSAPPAGDPHQPVDEDDIPF
jgi:single-strand DNA-binding protein